MIRLKILMDGKHFLPMIGKIYCASNLSLKNGWLALLLEKPELASECDKWEKFNSWDWSRLLCKQPQFADKCDKWDEFLVSDWESLIE